MLLLLWGALAVAAVPVDVVPVTAPVDAQQQFDAHREAKGLPPASLVCSEVWTGAMQVCFRIKDGSVMRFVDDSDLAAWGVDAAGLRSEMTERAKQRLPTQVASTDIADMPGHKYWYTSGEAGWECGPLLVPGALTALVGGPVLVAMPRADVLIAWAAGNEDLDRVMAIGIREMHDAGEGLSAVVYEYGDSGWAAAFEATRAGAP